MSRFEALHGSGLTEFVGRGHDIGLLLDCWRLALEGDGQAVLLSGEAGIGKSRVLREFANCHDGEDQRSLRYQCSPHEINSAFQPIIWEIEASAGFRPEDSTEDCVDKLEEHFSAIFQGRLPAETATQGVGSVPDILAQRNMLRLFADLLGLPLS